LLREGAVGWGGTPCCMWQGRAMGFVEKAIFYSSCNPMGHKILVSMFINCYNNGKFGAFNL